MLTTCLFKAVRKQMAPVVIIVTTIVRSPVLVYFGSRRERESWNWAWVISTRLARQVGYLELLLKLMFVNPPELPEQTTRALPVR